MESAKSNQILTNLLAIKDFNRLALIAGKLSHLKGKQSQYHNLTIVDIIVCPVDQELFQAFFRQYLISKNWEIITSLLKNVDLEIIALLGDSTTPTLFVNVNLRDLIIQEGINPGDLLR
ncbi:MAG TPA: hypothetical protein VN922_02460 [Bacteroidia bacterium]|nr:hypothetical protein [Bacteroidia bacterium]